MGWQNVPANQQTGGVGQSRGWVPIQFSTVFGLGVGILRMSMGLVVVTAAF